MPPKSGRRRRHPVFLHDDPTTWLTRHDVAVALGKSTMFVRRLEQAGRLTPVKDVDGVWRFHLTEVKELAERYRKIDKRRADELASMQRYPTRGDLEAAVFAAFERGMSRPEIVKALRVPIAEVQALYEQWKVPSCEDALRAKHREEQRQRMRQAAEMLMSTTKPTNVPSHPDPANPPKRRS